MIELNMNHLFRLIDDTGILKSSKLGVPDPKGGYMTGDNARGMIVAVMLNETYKEKKYEDLICRFASFLLNAQKKDGGFCSYMAYDRRFLEEGNIEATLGICLWALGYTVRSANVSPGLKEACRLMLKRAVPRLDSLEAPKAKAFAVLGLCYAVREMEAQAEIEDLAGSLVRQFKLYSHDGWDWFEDILTYGNAVLPWSCLKAYKALRNPDYLKAALDSLEFLRPFTFRADEYYKPIGTQGWISRGQKPAEFDEKPVDVAITALTYLEAFYLFKEIKYLNKSKLCLAWFKGQNSSSAPMLEKESGAVYDAITAEGINKDQGAESLLSYLMVVLSLKRFLNQE